MTVLAPPLRRYAPLWPWLNGAGVAILVGFWLLAPTGGWDAGNLHALDMSDPYGEAWHRPGSFVYSPAFAQLMYPFTLLSLDVFEKLLLGVNLVALVWLVGPAWGAASLALLPVSSDLLTGQVHLLLAAALVLGFRHGGAWAFLLLTKVTPGVGLLWFAGRREWRPLVQAVGVTAAIVLVSAILWPVAWGDWLKLLSESSSLVGARHTFIDSPITMRLPIAALLVVLAAHRDRPAAIPLIVFYALPAVWLSGFALLAAIPRMRALSSGKPSVSTPD